MVMFSVKKYFAHFILDMDKEVLFKASFTYDYFQH